MWSSVCSVVLILTKLYFSLFLCRKNHSRRKGVESSGLIFSAKPYMYTWCIGHRLFVIITRTIPLYTHPPGWGCLLMVMFSSLLLYYNPSLNRLYLFYVANEKKGNKIKCYLLQISIGYEHWKLARTILLCSCMYCM